MHHVVGEPSASAQARETDVSFCSKLVIFFHCFDMMEVADIRLKLRIRRVKCDEAKPWCMRCMGTGRKCDGYAVQEQTGLLFVHATSADLGNSRMYMKMKKNW